MANKGKYYITTAIAYTSRKPHIGNSYEIVMTDEAKSHTYVAGAKLSEGKLLTSGGRVTGTTAVAESLEMAIKEAYRLADDVKFENAYRRSDIGRCGLAAYE